MVRHWFSVFFFGKAVFFLSNRDVSLSNCRIIITSGYIRDERGPILLCTAIGILRGHCALSAAETSVTGCVFSQVDDERLEIARVCLLFFSHYLEVFVDVEFCLAISHGIGRLVSPHETPPSPP